MSADLAAFLLARIAEDEADARLLLEQRARLGQPVLGGSYVIVPFDETGHPGDPARVLAECEARRRIVERYRVCEPCYDEGNRLETRVLDWTMRLLALPFADHPDFDPSWRL